MKTLNELKTYPSSDLYFIWPIPGQIEGLWTGGNETNWGASGAVSIVQE